jgi:hypothetical protein
MSRTDVHRPWHVQVADPHNRHLLYRYPMWPWQMALTSFRNIGCGCKMCTGQVGRKLAHRQERVAWRATARRLLAEVDREDVDVPPLRGSAW